MTDEEMNDTLRRERILGCLNCVCWGVCNLEIKEDIVEDGHLEEIEDET